MKRNGVRQFAFISRHEPTPAQISLAAQWDGELIAVGDRDGFSLDPKEFKDYDAVIVVHAAAALRLIPTCQVGIFENGNRAPEGERPAFEAVGLHWFEPSTPFPWNTMLQQEWSF